MQTFASHLVTLLSFLLIVFVCWSGAQLQLSQQHTKQYFFCVLLKIQCFIFDRTIYASFVCLGGFCTRKCSCWNNRESSISNHPFTYTHRGTSTRIYWFTCTRCHSHSANTRNVRTNDDLHLKLIKKTEIWKGNSSSCSSENTVLKTITHWHESHQLSSHLHHIFNVKNYAV